VSSAILFQWVDTVEKILLSASGHKGQHYVIRICLVTDYSFFHLVMRTNLNSLSYKSVDNLCIYVYSGLQCI